MGLKKISKKAKDVKPKVTRAQTDVINRQSVGDEPTWRPGQRPTPLEKAYALNWYATCGEIEGARKSLIGYFTRRGETERAELLANVPNTCFPRTPSWLARMEELGADVSESETFIRSSADDVISKYGTPRVEDEAAPVTPRVSPADAKYGAMVANLDDVIDQKMWSYNVYDEMKKNGFPTTKAAAVAAYYSPLLDEIRVAIANTDVQVYEGYRRETKKALREQEAWLVTLLEDCTKYNRSERAATPRKKKAPSAEKKLKSFTWLKESAEFKAGSVDPVNVIGAKKVYLFNVKYKIMTVLVGESLDVKGKSIVGHDESKSWTVPMGRRAAEAVTAVTQGNEAAIVRRLDELRKGKNPWPRVKNLVDSNTLVLRTVSR